MRKDVDEIKRENFEQPDKNDEYSTSVLGIQFRRANSEVQIISRYNHTVFNPNCTLNDDLDRLAPGLKQSFANLLKERGMNLDTTHTEALFEILGYTLAGDGKYYKYNMEVNGDYFCPGNIIISGGEPTQVIEPEKGIVIDNFLLDLENKKISCLSRVEDSFLDGLQDIDKVQVKSAEDKKGKIIEIYLKDKEKPVIIGIDNDNQITRYENQYLKQVGNDFLCENRALTKLNLPQLEKVGGYFLNCNETLREVNLPQLQEVGDYFLNWNEALTKLNLPQLKEAGDCFLCENRALTKLNLPQLKQVGNYFLYSNRALTKLNLPQLENVGDRFLRHNRALTELDLPQLKEVECLEYDDFLGSNKVLTKVNLPQLKKVGNYFLEHNRALRELNLPQLEKVGDYFLNFNRALTKVNLPQLKEVGDCFLCENRALRELNLPQLEDAGFGFLLYNEALTKVNLPQLKEVGNRFLENNRALAEANLPQLETVGYNFLYFNRALTKLNLPQLENVGSCFLRYNEALREVNLPQIPELESKLKNIAIKNQPKKEEITPTDIAVLDRKSELTTSEIEDVKNNKKIEKTSKDERDVSR